jgi:hypothetical protein
MRRGLGRELGLTFAVRMVGGSAQMARGLAGLVRSWGAVRHGIFARIGRQQRGGSFGQGAAAGLLNKFAR